MIKDLGDGFSLHTPGDNWGEVRRNLEELLKQAASPTTPLGEALRLAGTVRAVANCLNWGAQAARAHKLYQELRHSRARRRAS